MFFQPFQPHYSLKKIHPYITSRNHFYKFTGGAYLKLHSSMYDYHNLHNEKEMSKNVVFDWVKETKGQGKYIKFQPHLNIP